MQTDHADPRETESIRRAYQTLRPLLLSEPSFRASVCSLTKRTVHFERVLCRIERRTIERRSVPAPGSRSADVEPLISPAFEAWQVDLEELPRATRQLCVCPACQGASEQACPACDAYERRVHTWLEVARAERREVCASPRALALAWHPAALDEADFSRDAAPHRLGRDELLSVEQIQALPAELKPALSTADRLVEVRLQRVAVDVREVVFQSALGQGLVALAGEPLAVLRVVRTPWTRRTWVAAAVLALGAIVSIAAVLSYRVQHPWFAEYGQGSAALCLGLGATLLAALASLGWLCARGARTPRSTWWPTASGVALAAGCAALLASARPSVTEARSALVHGDLQRAAKSADALGALGAAASDRALLLDDIRLARMARANTLDAKVSLAASAPWSRARRPLMVRTLRADAEPYAARARDAHDDAALSQLSALLAPVLPGEAHALAVQAATLTGETCLARGELECAERALGELKELGAVTARERAQRDLVEIVRARFERAFTAVSRSRTAELELLNVSTAIALADKLDSLGSALPRSLRTVLEHARERASRQVEAAEHVASRPSPRAPEPERRRAYEPRSSLMASTRPRSPRW